MNIIVGIFFLVFGLFGAINPKLAFKMDLRNIWYKNAEPNEVGICVTRFGSIILALLGILCIFSKDFAEALFNSR